MDPAIDDFINRWNPEQLVIRTFSIETALEPFANELEVFMDTATSIKKFTKRKTRRTNTMIVSIEKSVADIIAVAKRIAFSRPSIMHDMLCAVEEIRVAGLAMGRTARAYCKDPTSPTKLEEMTIASQNLLSAVTRQLITEDMIEVNQLLKALNDVQNDLENILYSTEYKSLLLNLEPYRTNIQHLMQLATKRLNDLKNPVEKSQMSISKDSLSKHSALIEISSAVYLRHPTLEGARWNRDYAFTQMYGAVDALIHTTRGIKLKNNLDEPGELATAFNILYKLVETTPMDYDDVYTRNSLEVALENILRRAAFIAKFSPNYQSIVAGFATARSALQDLILEYMLNEGTEKASERLEKAASEMMKLMSELRATLRKTCVDRFALCTKSSGLLTRLILSARTGKFYIFEKCARDFTKLMVHVLDVSNWSCSISNDYDGVLMVRLAVYHMNMLYPQVVSAAKMLVTVPTCAFLVSNIYTLHSAFDQQVRTLTEVVGKVNKSDV